MQAVCTGSPAQYSIIKALLLREIPEYQNSTIDIGSKQYSFVESPDALNEVNRSIYPYITALYYDLDDSCESCFNGELTAGRFPEAFNEIMVSEHFLEMYGADISRPEEYTEKDFTLNGKFLRGTKVVGVIRTKKNDLTYNIYIPASSSIQLADGQYYIYLDRFDSELAQKVTDDIKELTGIEFFTGTPYASPYQH
ncbi:hypothetical protein [Ruminococcus sp.]|uniref:hypothetical protein n=1 Tax=Ruminococcus sp. TaxID=41978 RepID=UPI0025E4540F|nr:hypothetical protein [Ruminococcus sp.]MBQ8965962.1 hypothetical protein [Ruminococcus sp.]